MNTDVENQASDMGRRDVLRGTGAVMVAGVIAASASNATPAAARVVSQATSATRNGGSLGMRLQGVQHFGLTVQNMDRAYEFYTQVLGGTEIMRDGDFQYRDADQPMGGNSFAEPRDHMSPAYPRSMHICFHIRDDVDFNQLIRDLEAESARRGMTQVKANRVITVASERERLAAPLEANTNRITEGRSNGWALIYCKGCEGEQLEFVQALGPVKTTFDDALASRGRAVAEAN